jgi:hypothetical protein
MSFKKASKKQSKLRLALFAPSGGGKTFTALRIATGIGGSIAVIDTEKGSASKYADRFGFDVSELTDPKIENYISLIEEAHGYDILVIDSLTHGWQELLEQIDRIAKAKYRGNTWSAWSEGTPKQRALVNAILSFPGHIIATMRVKTEWTTETDNKGKTRPVRVGLSPEQGKGIEYEFDLLMQMSEDHIGHVIKDRTGKFQDQLLEKPGEEFGASLKAWLSEGIEGGSTTPVASEPAQPESPSPAPKKRGRKPKTSASADPAPTKSTRTKTKKEAASLFPLVSDAHKELESLLKENKSVFSDAHFQWIVDQVINDQSNVKAVSMLDHVKQVCANMQEKAI